MDHPLEPKDEELEDFLLDVPDDFQPKDFLQLEAQAEAGHESANFTIIDPEVADEEAANEELFLADEEPFRKSLFHRRNLLW